MARVASGMASEGRALAPPWERTHSTAARMANPTAAATAAEVAHDRAEPGARLGAGMSTVASGSLSSGVESGALAAPASRSSSCHTALVAKVWTCSAGSGGGREARLGITTVPPR
jgi:hypothetical protein